jgi:2',3'-cyclic-nucleotide 2'-phosphodiesterase (5'-nucleotidase family)
MREEGPFFRTLTLGLIFMVLLSPISQAKLIQILHTNDTHSYLDGATHSKTTGGAARLKYLMDYYKEQAKAQNIETIALDGGDFTEGNVYYMADHAKKSFEIHDQMGLDASAVGNHDYLMGAHDLDRILLESDMSYSLLCANMTISDRFKGIKEKIKPFSEINIAGLKIGLIGLTTNEIFYTWRFDAGKITAPIKAFLNYEDVLKKRGNDFIIALTHIGYKTDMKLAKKSKYLDLVVGGHSHTALFDPIYVESKSKKNIPIVQAGMHTEYLGKLIIDLEKNKPLKVISYELIPTRYEGMDYKVRATVEEADNEINTLYGKDWLNKIVGFSDLKVDDPEGSRKWAYFITDLLRERTGADIAIHTPPMNGEEFPVGNISRRNIINSIPRVFDISEKYGWSMYTSKIRGAFLRMTFEALALFGQPLTFSGIKVEYIKTPIGIKIKNVLINGKKMNPMKLYTVAFTEGIIKGAEGVSPYTLSLLRNPVKTPIKIWQAIEEKLQKENKMSFKNLNENDHQLVMPSKE